jgi:hypothetical protein
MDTRRWHIQDHAALMAALGEIIQVQPPFVITVKQGEETRRDRQNRFAFEAYRQIAKMLGDRTTEDVRSETKLHIGVPIMRAADPDFQTLYDEMIRPLPYEHKRKMMIEPFDFAVTRGMTVKQMGEYITQMLAYWDERGASAMMERYDL